MPQNKPRILCTGPVEKSLINSAPYQVADIDVIPFTRISIEILPEVQHEIRELFRKKLIVVFTSNNAVKAVAALLDNEKPDWTIFCIGNTTYQLACTYFGKEKISQTASNAAALAEKIIPLIGKEEVFFFCGNLRRNDLPQALRENGTPVKEILVYHTSLSPVEVEKDYDAILFFSPSSAESFFSCNTIGENAILFVMGKTTETAIRKFADNRVVTGKEPDKATLIREAIQYVITHPVN